LVFLATQCKELTAGGALRTVKKLIVFGFCLPLRAYPGALAFLAGALGAQTLEVPRFFRTITLTGNAA
jgi:hypothetical protein